MSRLQVLAANPRLALGALVTLLLAVGAVVGSGADFTASSANPANTFSSGTLSILNEKQGQAILSASGMRPGDPAQTGTVDITNDGSLTGTFTLVRGAVSNSDAVNPMAAKLNVTVVDCGAYAGAVAPTCGDPGEPVMYTGTLADMGTAGHEITSLGSFATGDKRRYRFSVALDSSAGNAYQGDSATAEFDFNAA
jgi:spore coat-associated protein N